MDPIGVRIQGLALGNQTLVLARLAAARSSNGLFAPAHLDALFDEFGLVRPAKTSNVLAGLEKSELLTRARVAGKAPNWQLTPVGRQRSEQLAGDMDLAALMAEATSRTVTLLGNTPHPVIPPSLAPPELIAPLRRFFDDFPFERNVFGMTRFPSRSDQERLDPIAPAIERAREACKVHGLNFHLASDRQIADGLWANVAAHIWGCQYGIAFFEDRTGRGLNYNLTIEVGSCLVLGRRLAILKDPWVQEEDKELDLPSDLVDKIYKTVDLEKPETVDEELHAWIRDDLSLGACSLCPD